MGNKETAIVKAEPAGALQKVPEDLVQNAGAGTEGIGASDVRPPRLCVAQSNSPQVKRGNVKFVDGLREGNLFNDLSGENYGDGPVRFVVVRYLGTRAIQFNPDKLGEVLDFNVPLDDPRCQFTTDKQTGKRMKPMATRFMEYLVWLPDQAELAALSLKGTQLKEAIQMNSLVKLPLKIEGSVLTNPPSWARPFTIKTEMQHKDKYDWAGVQIRTGWTDPSGKYVGITPIEVRAQAAAFFAAYKDASIKIEVEPDVEAEAVQHGNDADVPF